MAVRITELSSIALEGSDWVGEARRQVVRLGYSIGFQKEVISRIELVVTEMATNLIQHRTVSPILRFGITQTLEETGAAGPDSARGLLVISEDRGPGIVNLEQALQDRYSTAGTMGGGLGAIRRHSEEFSLASDTARPGRSHPGTVVASRFWLAPPPSHGTVDCEILTRPKPGEIQNGDGVSFSRIGDRHQLALIDGLGHGAEAFKSTQDIQEVFRTHPSLRMPDLMERAHRAMHGGRGAVVGILQLDQREGQIRYVGVGNIDCRIYGKNPARPISMNGSLGVVLPRCREESYPFSPDDFFVMASDGISTRWEPESYPQFLRVPLVMKGALLFRDYSRLTDDATLAVGSFKKR
jgi:anti-sigma regulatory factor (Ser/Thr protein kinase)